MSPVQARTPQQKLRDWLELLTHIAYHDGPVPYEMIAEMHDKVVIAIADGDVVTLSQLREWFIMLPSENFACNETGDLTDLRDIRDLLDQALKIVVSPELIAELRHDGVKRRILEYASLKLVPATTQRISSVFQLDEENVLAAATWLRASGCLEAKMEHPQDPGFTWTITVRGQRAYEALYR